jgi:dehypoxanthine futalosine cyclase
VTDHRFDAYEQSAEPVSSLTLRWPETPPAPAFATGATPPAMARIRDAVAAERRLTREEGLYLLAEAPLIELGALAQRARFARLPEPIVTYVLDSNPNYTNVCTVDCHFCAFYRKPGHAEAYTLTIPQVLDHVRHAQALGCTTVLLQGGLNPEIPFSFYVDLVAAVRREFPRVTPHFFSAPEIQQMAEVSGLTIRGVLQALRDAGQTTLPGGGAEILSDRVRRRVGPRKGPVERWLEVHRQAHALGMRSTATMMYGHLDTAEDRLEHLDHVRRVQDEAIAAGQPGFTAFVPWSYKRDQTRLARKVPRSAGAAAYLRVLAASRLYLDNVAHVQASWFSEGKRAGQTALHFGADDFGGTLFEENVHKATGFVNKTSAEEIRLLIAEAGFTPAQRSTTYEILQRDPSPAPREWATEREPESAPASHAPMPIP